jgi:hypothetical protein
VTAALDACGATIMGVMASPVIGPAGNVEFLVHARAHGEQPDADRGRRAGQVDDMIERALGESPRAGSETGP